MLCLILIVGGPADHDGTTRPLRSTVLLRAARTVRTSPQIKIYIDVRI
jgi:hypothetical protein